MKKLVLGMAVIAMLFASCKEEENVTPTPTVENELSGDISGTVTLDASIEYKLTGSLQILDGGVLTIPAGTVIKADKGFNKYILVEMGGKIYVNGTAEKPVIMKSGEASPKSGDWGGLVINGKAKLSGVSAGTTSTTEINPAVIYGGDIDTDNSGSITYLILEHTGAKSSADVEHNGLTLNAVGSGTTIENIFVKNGSDDGIEFFGGSVNVKNLLVVNPDDDMFDLTQGWKGTLDNAYGVWEAGYTSSEADPRGIESDGNLDGLGPDDVQQSNYTMTNISIVNKSTFQMHDGIKVRRGATATITNVLLSGGSIKDIVDITDSKGAANTATSIEYKVTDVVSEKTLNGTSTTITEKTTNTGANTTVFSWTGYNFN